MVLSGYQYNCSGGETWDRIALEVYGNERYASELLTANPELDHKSIFVGGEAVLLPRIDLPHIEGDEDYVTETAPWKE